jgi:SOS response regulatory protein OraA/RecX
VRIESVRFDASGNASLSATGGISFFIPLDRVGELAEALRSDGEFSEKYGKVAARGDAASDTLTRRAVAAGAAPANGKSQDFVPGNEKKANLTEIAYSKVHKLEFEKEVLRRAALDELEFSVESLFWKAVVAIDEETRARTRALSLCARAEQSKIGLSAKLAARGFSRAAIAAAIAALEGEGIVDDARYARAWGSGRAERRACGPALLAAELRARGQGEDAVRSAIEAIDFDRILARAVQREMTLLDKKLRSKTANRQPKRQPNRHSSRQPRWSAELEAGPEAKRDSRAAGEEASPVAVKPKSYWDTLYRALKAQGFDGEKIQEEIEKLQSKTTS